MGVATDTQSHWYEDNKFKSIQGEVRCVRGELYEFSDHLLILTSSRYTDTQPNSYQHTEQLWVVVGNGGVKVCDVCVQVCGLCVCVWYACVCMVCVCVFGMHVCVCMVCVFVCVQFTSRIPNAIPTPPAIIASSRTLLWVPATQDCNAHEKIIEKAYVKRTDTSNACNERMRRSERRTSFQASCATSP